HNEDGRCPDDAMRAKVRLILGVVEQEPNWDEALGDELLDWWMRIRHGIQRNASGSVLTAEIRHDEPALTLGPRQRGGEIVLPDECDTLHTCSLSESLYQDSSLYDSAIHLDGRFEP